MPSDTNPVLENVDDAIDVVEKFITDKVKDPFKNVGLGLIGALRTFLKVPDNYGGDAD